MLDEREGAGRRAGPRPRLQPPERRRRLRDRGSRGRSRISFSRSCSTGSLFMHGVPGLKPVRGRAAVCDTGRAGRGLRSGRHDHQHRRRDGCRHGRTRAGCSCSMRCRRRAVTIEVRDTARRAARSASSTSPDSRAADLDSDFLRALGPHALSAAAAAVIGNVVSRRRGGTRWTAKRATKSSRSTISRSTAWEDVVTAVRAHPGARLMIEVRRTRPPRRTIPITPDTLTRTDEPIGRIGAGAGDRSRGARWHDDHGSALRAARKHRQGALQDVGHVDLQPADAREDDRRRSVAQESERARSRSPTTRGSQRRAGSSRFCCFSR